MGQARLKSVTLEIIWDIKISIVYILGGEICIIEPGVTFIDS